MNELLERMWDFRPRIAVVGDAMLDEYHEVQADKVSPEFPIPVLKSPDGEPRSVRPGGAGNVCSQLLAFNFDTSLFALTNERFKWCLKGANMDGCIFSKSVPVKKRYYSGDFPLCRLDEEKKGYGLDRQRLLGLQTKILSNLSSSGPFDVVVFSDYDKGMFHGLPNPVSAAGDAITIVDPKRGPMSRWKGCSIIKPNANEARDITGFSDPHDQCSAIMDETGCQAVVITQGGDGVFGNVQGSWFECRPSETTQARSVVGAGDCFVAFLAMCMCHSIDIRRAAGIAFEACSLYVREPRNTPVRPYQLEPTKFVDPRNLVDRDFSLAFANGCFDVLHPGHVELLKFAKSKADMLAVALNTDESVARQNKDHPLVNTLDHRKAMVAAIGCVDFVLDFSEDTPRELINRIKPDVLVKGSDWPEPVGSDLVPEVLSFPIVGGHSTSGIVRKIMGMKPI